MPLFWFQQRGDPGFAFSKTWQGLIDDNLQDRGDLAQLGHP
jgi:hypothetical protein